MENHSGSDGNVFENTLHSDSFNASNGNEINQTNTTVLNETERVTPLLSGVLEVIPLEADSSNITFSNVPNRELSPTSNYNGDPSSDSVVINVDRNRNNPGPSAHNFVSQLLRYGLNNPNSNIPSSGNEAQVQCYLEGFKQKYLTLIIFLLITTIVYDNIALLFSLALVFATFIFGNGILEVEVSKQAQRSLSETFVILIVIFWGLLILILIVPLAHKNDISLGSLLWTLLKYDFHLKLLTVFLKTLFTMLPACMVPFQKRGKIYLFMESLSQLCRSLATIYPWLYFISEAYYGIEQSVALFLYGTFKSIDLFYGLSFLKTATLKLSQNIAFGSSPNKKQIKAAGKCCTICYDEFDSPVLLQCQHIFCETCISAWFDTKQTCPVCRTTIVEDLSWRDGSTTFFVQLF